MCALTGCMERTARKPATVLVTLLVKRKLDAAPHRKGPAPQDTLQLQRMAATTVISVSR